MLLAPASGVQIVGVSGAPALLIPSKLRGGSSARESGRHCRTSVLQVEDGGWL
jgi:hypothetical protein